jgi:hypothetical protein
MEINVIPKFNDFRNSYIITRHLGDDVVFLNRHGYLSKYAFHEIEFFKTEKKAKTVATGFNVFFKTDQFMVEKASTYFVSSWKVKVAETTHSSNYCFNYDITITNIPVLIKDIMERRATFFTAKEIYNILTEELTKRLKKNEEAHKNAKKSFKDAKKRLKFLIEEKRKIMELKNSIINDVNFFEQFKKFDTEKEQTLALLYNDNNK